MISAAELRLSGLKNLLTSDCALDASLLGWGIESRSDAPMVAVGFEPTDRIGGTERRRATVDSGSHTFNRRSATLTYTDREPWVETHGYLRGSLRDSQTNYSVGLLLSNRINKIG